MKVVHSEGAMSVKLRQEQKKGISGSSISLCCGCCVAALLLEQILLVHSRSLQELVLPLPWQHPASTRCTQSRSAKDH